METDNGNKDTRSKTGFLRDGCFSVLSESLICDGTPQWHQLDSSLEVENERPARGAVVAKPEVLNEPLLLPCANKGWRNGFARLWRSLGLHQKQFALAKF
jgi:hypothetical protein